MFVDLSTDLAASLASKIPELAQAGQGDGGRRTVRLPEGGNSEGGNVVVTVLPGANTRALLSNRQRVTDIEILSDSAGPSASHGTTAPFSTRSGTAGRAGRLTFRSY